MKASLTGVAKRLTLSLLAATALGGCAVYEPAYTGTYAYDPYPYGRTVYPSYYAGPPLSIDLLFDGRGGGHHYGGRGFRGHGGNHGSWGHRGDRGGGWGGRRH